MKKVIRFFKQIYRHFMKQSIWTRTSIIMACILIILIIVNKGQLNLFVNILKYIKSNAIALFDKDSLVSQSGGQTSRVDALENCFYKLKQKHDYKKLKSLSLFSDAFFPFTDSLEFIKKEKMKIDIFAPMGSQNDKKIEAYVKKNKLNFFKLSDRHFKH